MARLHSVVTLAVVSLLAFLSGCGSGSSKQPTLDPIISVSFNPKPPSSVAEGAVQSITASVTNDSGNKGISWAISPASGCGTLSANAGTTVNYTAPSPLPSACTATITVTAIADVSKTASSMIGVNLTGVTITSPTSNPSIAAGATVPFAAAITNDGTGSGITWTLSPATGCGNLSSATGTSTTYNSPMETSIASACSANVKATSTADTTKSASLSVASNPIAVSAITSSSSTPPATVAQNSAAVPLSSTVAWDASNGGLLWSVNPATCGTLGSVSVTANTSQTTFIPAASVTRNCAAAITVASVTDPNKKSAVTITVTTLNALAVNISPSTPTNVTEGTTQNFTASVSGDVSNKGVNWSLNPASGCGSFSSRISTTAIYQAPEPAAGAACTVTVIATSAADSTKSASDVLSIVQPPISVSVPGGTFSLDASNGRGNSQISLTATITDDFTSKGIAWTMTNPSCGTIVSSNAGANATFTAAADSTLTANCVTNLTATSIADSTKSAIAITTVYPITMDLSPSGPQNVSIGGNAVFTANVHNDAVPGPGASTAGVSWSLSPATSCGTLANFSPVSVTYIAPSSLSSSCSVALAATSVADSAKSKSESISVNVGSAMVIYTSQRDIGNGLINTAYQTFFSVGGGVEPYTFTVASGALPDGLAFLTTSPNVIAGTPRVAGTFQFAVKVTDSASNTLTSPTFAVVISSAPEGKHNSYLNGRYTCLLEGYLDSDGSRYANLSSLVADAAGNITDNYWDDSVFEEVGRSAGVSSGTLKGTYSLGADNNGILTLRSFSGEISTDHLRAIMANHVAGPVATEFRMLDLDEPGIPSSGRHGSGVCYRANASAFRDSTITGRSFAFGLRGEDGSGAVKAAAGRFSVFSNNILDGALDQKKGNALTFDAAFTGHYTSLNETGRTTLTFTIGSTTSKYAAYVIDLNRLFMLRIDGDEGFDGGELLAQQQASYSNSNVNRALALYWANFEVDSTNTTQGYMSHIFQGTGSGDGSIVINQSYEEEAPVSGGSPNYTVGGANRTYPVSIETNGRMTIDGAPGGSESIVYLYDNNSGVMFDGSTASSGNTNVGVGWMEAQSLTTFIDNAIAGNYVMGRTAVLNANQGGEADLVTLDAAGNITEISDSEANGNSDYGTTISGNYNWDSTVLGTFGISRSGQQVLSCVAISATKFSCIDNQSGTPSVQVAQQ